MLDGGGGLSMAARDGGRMMAHLGFEYSASLGEAADMQAFCTHMRDAMLGTGVFPLGGIRVRGTRVDVCTVASGDETFAFLDLVLRMGAGRDEATRETVCDTLYDAAEAWLRAHLQIEGMALSLEVLEIDPRFSRKRYNTLHKLLGQPGG